MNAPAARRPAPAAARVARQWLLAFLLSLSCAVFLAALTAARLTARGPGERIHERAVLALTGLDAALPGIEDALHTEARGSDAASVRVPGFPIPVDLLRAEAAELGGPALRERLLDEAAARLYEDGMSAWAAGDPSSAQRIDRFSAAGMVHWSLGLVRDGWHAAFLLAAAVSGAACLLLAAALTLSLSGVYMRLLALGGALLGAALPSLAAAVALRFALKTAQVDGDPFLAGLLEIGVDAAGFAIRQYLIAASAALGVIAVAAGAAWLEARRGATHTPLPS